MNGQAFDAAVRRLDHGLTRRGVFVAGLWAALAARGPLPEAAAAKHKHHRKHKKHKKPKKNAFGCLDVGQACNGKDDQCCSGICDGKKPKHGEKDKSRCVAHDTGICQPGIDVCQGIQLECANGFCFQTTGKAPFCAGGTGACTDCQKDTDCQAQGFGPGSACVFCPLICPETGGRVCFPSGA
jgi:hypothetical protein